MNTQTMLEWKEKPRPPLRYHGGKWMLAPWVLSFFPEHDQYVEPYGGGAGVLLRKPRSKVEIYNDLDDDVVNLFRVMRDQTLKKALIDQIAMTPFSRREFQQAYEVSHDAVERARRLLVRSWAGFGTHSFNIKNSNGFRTSDVQAKKSYAREWAGIPCALVAFAERINGVTIECRPAIDVIQHYGVPGTLFYLDPPYPHTTRNCGAKGYTFEMSDHDPRKLSFVLKSLKCHCVISGYPCSLYDEYLYQDWHRVERVARCNGQNGNVNRTEVLWMNFRPPST